MAKSLDFYCEECEKRFTRTYTNSNSFNPFTDIEECMYCHSMNTNVIWTMENPPRVQIQHPSKPTVVFRSKDGSISVPNSYNSPTPKGMVREEYKGLSETLRLEKELQKEANVVNEIRKISDNRFVEENRKQRHKELESNIDKIIQEEGKRIQESNLKDKSFDPVQAKDMLLKATKYSKERKRKRQIPESKPIIQANHFSEKKTI